MAAVFLLAAGPAWAEAPRVRLISELRREIPAAAIGFMLLGLGLAAGVAGCPHPVIAG